MYYVLQQYSPVFIPVTVNQSSLDSKKKSSTQYAYELVRILRSSNAKSKGGNRSTVVMREMAPGANGF